MRSQPVAASVISRFQGDSGEVRLIELLRQQLVVAGDAEIASELAAMATLVEVPITEHLIRQDDGSNELYFILSGSFRVFINGREVATRGQGVHVGEMSVIDPGAARSASVVASEASVVARIPDNAFIELADRHPRMWRLLAKELAHRLDERRKFHRPPNLKPNLFIGSSSEQKVVVEALRSAMPADFADVTVWYEDVFGASSFPIDDLETQVGLADFAVLVVGADDKVMSRGKDADAPRDNVVFELGLFMGALHRGRAFVVEPQGANVKLPTDILGMSTLRYDPKKPRLEDGLVPVISQLVELVQKHGPK